MGASLLAACGSGGRATERPVEWVLGRQGVRDLPEAPTRKAILSREKTAPRFQDSLGLAFAFAPDSALRYEVEYYLPADTLAAAVINLYPKGVVDAQGWLEDLRLALTRRTGVNPTGAYGEYQWPQTAQGQWHLRLQADKRSLTIGWTAPAAQENLQPVVP
jgi:hypothetical protein